MPGRSSKAWIADHPWAKFYDWMTRHNAVGQSLWRVGMRSDLGLLHRTAASEFERLASGARVLDLPSGGGIAITDLPDNYTGIYVAADISPAMLERTERTARDRGVEVETVVADVEQLPWPDYSFDLVLTFTSLHVFPHPRTAVHELTRVIRPGGRLAGSSMLRGGPWHEKPAWIGGTTLGVLGPGCTHHDLASWLAEDHMIEVDFRRSGGITYFTATKGS